MNGERKGMTLIIFSNDMDRAMASFILAAGAASSGMEVTMYFTFWGLSLLRRKNGRRKGKTFVERLFGRMLPEGPDETRLSRMNFLGAGTSMMKRLMRKKRMPALGELMDMARSLDVKMVACTTSMAMMGIGEEELIDGVEVGGVATYLGKAGKAAINLFI